MSDISSSIILQSGREQSLLRRHPWVFSGAIKRIDGQPVDGDVVRVLDNKGRFLAIGHYFEGSISVKVLSFEDVVPDQHFWFNKINNAWQRRLAAGFSADNNTTNAFRLIHGEGDDLPGLIADFYHGILVIQAHSIGMHRHLNEMLPAFQQVLGFLLKGVFDKSCDTLPPQYAAQYKNQWLLHYADNIIIHEHGVQYKVDVEHGQKTGFFLDQRDNRHLLATYSKGKSVLNTFCYSGGFSLAAVLAGASQVHSVDVSATAIALTQANALLNQVGDDVHQAFKADVLEFLRQGDALYDIVILDPPAFAKSVAKRHNAVQGYKRLNIMGINRVKPGGLLFTFSCSQVVDASLFLNTITAAAIESGRPTKILHRLSQPPDHPVNIFHPEGSYLKGLVLQID